MNSKSLLLGVVMGGMLLQSQPVSAVETTEVELSLGELMNLKIDVGTLTGMARNKIPVSLTTISAEDIALTPARNINDLVEVYVPGATWTAHSEMGHIGIRGVMSDRNVKFLLLVNGYEMNQLTHAGAVSEIENWDLNEVDRIEVIRGPGSVTYGPGAIAGVINIVTKSAQDWGGLRVGAAGNLAYRGAGGYATYGKQMGDFQLYTYASLVATKGQEKVKAFIAPDSTYGYSGDDWKARATAMKDSRANNPLSYGGTSSFYSDYKGYPQGKIMADGRYKDWRLQARFTNSGNPQVMTSVPASAPNPDGGERMAINQNQIRQYLTAAENEHKFSDMWKQITKVSWNDQDYSRWILRDTNQAYDQGRNYVIAFSEKHLTTQTLAQLSPSENYRFAIGASYSYNMVRAPWGQNSSAMRLGDGQNFFGGTAATLGDSASNQRRGIFSPYATRAKNGKLPSALAGTVYDSTIVWVGDGWSTNSYALLGEANLAFHPLATVLLSGRADKDDFSNWALSPRVAVISEINEQNILKLIWQRSVRINNGEISYQQNLSNTISDPEVLTGYEAIYNYQPKPELAFQASGFYNDFEILGFNRSNSLTQNLGTLNMAGMELEGKYSTPKLTFGFSHSFAKQVDFTLSSDTSVKGGISYADIRYKFIAPGYDSVGRNKANTADSIYKKKGVDTIYMAGTGNDVLNWSNHSSKLYANWKVIEPVTLHLDARISWGIQGEQEAMNALLDAASKLPARDSVYVRELKAEVAAIKSHDAFEPDFRINASVAWKILPWLSTTLYCQNLLDYQVGTWDSNKRYAYDAVNNGIWPSRQSWIEEPRMIGLRIDGTIPGM